MMRKKYKSLYIPYILFADVNMIIYKTVIFSSKHKQAMSLLIVNFTTTPVLFSIVAWLYLNNSLNLENVFLDC